MMTENDSQVECFELYMLDISTSMGRRDGFFNFWGKTRFQLAKDYLSQVLNDRKESKTIEVALELYDTSSAKCFGFCHITNKEIKAVAALEPNGPKTATYDAYKDCIEYLQRKGFQGAQQSRIIVITDGGDNFSGPENFKKYENLQLHLKKQHLMIHTIFLHMSTKNDGSKELAHALGWEYKQIRANNVDLISNGYLIDYPSEYTGMGFTERQKTKRIEATMERAPVPPETTPILQKHPRSKRTEIGKILVKESVEPILE